MKHRFGVLDIFRGIFASAVVLYHMGRFSGAKIVNNDFIKNADLFVDFFFVLSGFVLCYSYREINNKVDFKKFLTKRIYRLYPLHLIILIAFLAIEFLKFLLRNHILFESRPNDSLTTFISSLLLLNSVKLPGVTDLSWNPVSWSISAEWISYIVFAILCLSLSLLNAGRWKVIPYMILIVATYFALVKITGDTKLYYAYNYGFLRGLIGFFTGTVCLYVFDFTYHSVKNLPKLLFSFFELAMIALIIYFVANGGFYKKIAIIYELLFFLSIYVFAFQKGYISQFLNNLTILKNLGKFSYSIYMTHYLVVVLSGLVFLKLLKLPASSHSFLIILNCLVVYFLSAWTFKNIEMRFLKGIKSHHVIKHIG